MKKIIIVLLVIISVGFTPAYTAEYRCGVILVKFKQLVGNSSLNSRAYCVNVNDVEKSVSRWSKMPNVEYAEPDYLINAEDVPEDSPYTGNNWVQTGLTDAWDYLSIRPQGKKIRIAVVDSGVDLTHPELSDVLVPGWDFINNDAEADDEVGHGTKICGIIGAKGNNYDLFPYHTIGVAWNSNIEIMPLKFMTGDMNDVTGSISDAVSAIYYAVDNGASVINISWGLSSYSQSLNDSFSYARSMNVIMVCSAGNSGANNDLEAHYPSNFKLDNIITVAAMTSGNSLASFSNYGFYSVHLAAPGVRITATSLRGSYSNGNSGTSFAAPFATAVSAMLWSQRPDLSYTDIRNIVIEGSTETPSDYGQTDDYYQRYVMCSGSFNAMNSLTGVKIHNVVNNDAWTSPQSSAESGPVSESSSGSGCFIETTGI
jgi:hypothetical protein